MKAKYFYLCLAVILFLTACVAQPAPVVTVEVTVNAPVVTAVVTANAPAFQPVLKTDVGDLVYISSWFTKEANGVKPAPGCKLLLVEVKRADQAGIDLQKFVAAHMQVFIRGEDGSNTLSTMGGFVDNKFAIGFQVPETIQTYRLVWGENPPLEVFPRK